jgi:hypothetical protein
MAFLYNDRVKETSTTTGTGAVTLAGAVTGYQTFSAGIGSSNTCYYVIAHQILGEWEVGLGTLNAGATTLTRTTVLSSSNSNTTVTFSAGTKDVFVTSPAASQTQAIPTPGGRLSLTSATPVTVSDVTTGIVLYYTPYQNNRIDLYAGSSWRPFLFSELSASVPANTLTAGTPRDVFVYLSGSTPTLEVGANWTNSTTRSTALALQDGVWVKSGDVTRRYVGTICGAFGGTVYMEDSAAYRLVWNAYNQVNRVLAITDATSNWAYNTATWRQARATSSNRVAFVNGLAGTYCSVTVTGILSNGTSLQGGLVGASYDTTGASTAMPGGAQRSFTIRSGTAGQVVSGVATNTGYPDVGFHVINWVEIGTGTGTNTWYSSSSAGLLGSITG